MSNTDVLVVGAGPVGMAMANELSIQGVSFRIVDKASVRSDKSRAIGVQSRTVEVLNRYGDHVHDELLSGASKLTGTALWVNQKQYVLSDLSKASAAPVKTTTTMEENDEATPESQFHGPYVISQVDTEAFLEKRLTERGVAIEYTVAVKSLVQDADGVTAVLTRADGSEETVRCQYVVGCDGAHSVVRHAMNVTFEGDAYPQEFILADTNIDWDVKGSEGMFQTMLGDDLVMIFPMGQGRARITASRPGHGSSDEDPTLQDFDSLIAKLLPTDGSVPKPRLHDPFWLARFHLHHRCVTKYRDGRLFVAGDAAHIHSPAGGQGMNTGIQDSVNLGWKLARVLQGRAPNAEALLESYHEERWPVGQHLLTQTDQIFSFLTSSSKTFHFLRNLVVPLVAPAVSQRPELGRGLLHYASQLGVKYQRSPIVRTAPGWEGPVRGGFRAPEGRVLRADGEKSWVQNVFRGPGHHLLLFPVGQGEGRTEKEKEEEEEGVAAKFRDALHEDIQVHPLVSSADKQAGEALVDVNGELRKRYGFMSRSGYVLVRPDGYVADIGYL